MTFADRRDAGRRLARALRDLPLADPLVIALPRGGVPVGFEVATALAAPLEVLVARKLGAPGNPEYGIGAIVEGDTTVIDERAARAAGATAATLLRTVEAERRELARRVARYRGAAGPPDVRGRTVVLVDDGVATGVTDLAAARALRALGAERVVLAVPVGPLETIERLAAEVDEVVCLQTPEPFLGVGRWYEQFAPTSDEEVVKLLARRSALALGGARPSRRRNFPYRRVAIDIDEAGLRGDLRVPPAAKGLVIFAHGSGSSRTSPRNVAVADALAERRLASLLFDLLTDAEAQRRMNVFDIDLLSERLVAATRWAAAEPATAGLPLGFFGASTGAAAALRAAAALDGAIAAVVSRGGRPDLTGGQLTHVTAPTLLIVGSLDHEVLALNQAAARLLRCPHRVETVLGAGHLFEEPGALDAVTTLAGDWLERHLSVPPATRQPPLHQGA